MVRKSHGIEKARIEGAGVDEIIEQIRLAESRGAAFLTSEVETLRGKNNRETARNIWSFIRQNIEYREDGEHQRTQSPAHLWKTRKGDCKSMTVFAASVLQKLGVPYDLTVDFYNSDSPQKGHIFVTLKDGTILDPVNQVFNRKDRAWKTKKIPGATIGARTKNNTMSTIASYIEGRVGVETGGEKFSVPDRIINYAEMTDGELSVKLAARQNELFYIATGKDVYRKNADGLNAVLESNIQGRPIATTGALLGWAKKRIAEKDFPALTAYYFSRLYYADRARMGQLYTFEQYRMDEYKKCLKIREEWNNTSRLRFSKRAELRRTWEDCFQSVRYLGVINDQLERSGAHLLYNFAGLDVNQTVLTKKVLHRIAVDNYSRVFGLSTDNLAMWIRNGIIAENMRNGAGAMAPEETIGFMQANVSANYDKIGAILETIIVIIKVISVALAATQIILNRIGEAERQRLVANTQGLGTKPFGPEKEDFLQAVQSALQDQGVLIPLAALAAILFLE